MPTFIFSLEEKQPKVVIKETTVTDGAWTVSGIVVFQLAHTAGVAPVKLEFPFSNAKSEKEAIQQAAEQLKAVAETFASIAQSLLGQYTGGQK